MKAVVDSHLLAQELKKVSPVIKKTTIIPILECVKLEFAKTSLTITGTDLETTVSTSMPCESKAVFSFVIEFESLFSVLSKIPGQPVSIELSGDKINITSDNSKFSFTKTNDENAFPQVDEEQFGLIFNADDSFFYALYAADQCRKTDSLATNMNAACIHLKKAGITVVATDAHVLYKKDFKIKGAREEKLMIADTFIQMIRGLPNGEVSIGEKFIKAENGNLVVISRLLDSKYCGYEVVIPEEINYNFKASRKDFISTVSAALATCNRATKFCEINFSPDQLIITSQDADYGKNGEARIRVNNSSEIENIGVNGDQIIKLLNLFDSQDIEMSFTSPTKSIFIRAAGEPDTLCLLQPISILQNV